ncbi:MAG: IS110 family transposase [Chloroflexi bacterium]|nr:IS110 family transposase [Chloroflexota bacterium]
MRCGSLEGSIVEVFVGLDWGEQHHQVHALDGGGATRLSLRVPHDRSGLERLRVGLAALGNPSEVGVAIERREGLLVDHLLAWGHPVYPVNPKVAAPAREGYRAAPVKSDVLDAFALADLLRRQAAWRPLRPSSATHAELQALVRDRERFVIEHRRLQHQLRAILETCYPAATKLFSGLDRAISLSFLRRYPTPAEAERLTAHRLARFLARQGYTGRTAPEVLVHRIRAHAGTPNIGVDVARARAMLALVDLLEQVGRVLDEYAAAIAGVLERHPDAALFASFPGTGLVTTATLLAEIGEDRTRFPSAGSLLAEAGLAPVTRQSGSSRRVGFRYAANHHLRAVWRQWMLTTIRISPWTREAYDAARARGQSHSRAVRSVGARWGRILWRCWLDRQTYDPALDRRVAMAA